LDEDVIKEKPRSGSKEKPALACDPREERPNESLRVTDAAVVPFSMLIYKSTTERMRKSSYK
jgi:hypothetical protein